MSGSISLSTEYILPAALVALTMLVMHAILSHGYAFAALWLGLGGTLFVATAVALHRLDLMSLVFCHHAGRPVVLTEFFVVWTCMPYAAAVLAKGFIERSRQRGKALPFAAATAAFSVLLALPFEALNDVEGLHSFPQRTKSFLVASPPGYFLAFATGAFLFALTYRLVSLRTGNNMLKLLALALCLPLHVAIAAGVGWLTIR